MIQDVAHKYFLEGKRLLKINDYTSARKFFELAVQSGHIMAKAELGIMLLRWPNSSSHKTMPNTPLGLKYLKEASDAGLKSAAIAILEFARQVGGNYKIAIKAVGEGMSGPEPETGYLFSIYKFHPELFSDFLMSYKILPSEKNYIPIGKYDRLDNVVIPREEKVRDLFAYEECEYEFSEAIARDLKIGPDGIFSIEDKGNLRKVILYIPDHSYWSPAAVSKGHDSRNRLHVTDCITIEEMKVSGRFERYIVTNKLKGPYKLTWDTGLVKKYNMRICINCLASLSRLRYVDTTAKERERIARKFDVEDYVSEFGSRFQALPVRRWWDDDAH